VGPAFYILFLNNLINKGVLFNRNTPLMFQLYFKIKMHINVQVVDMYVNRYHLMLI